MVARVPIPLLISMFQLFVKSFAAAFLRLTAAIGGFVCLEVPG